MSSITAQQTKLDLELVPKENRLDIRKCNGRIPRGLTPREPTFQVVLDAIALTPCYPAFLITADVPEVYMHQFWNSVYKHDTFYRFKIDKKKRFKLTLEVFRDIFQICPRVPGRDFDPLPSEEDTVSFLRELGHTGEINSLNDVVVDQMHQPWRTFAALINRGLSGKTSGLDKLRLSRAQILWGMFYQKNVDYVELLWEDFIYQIENRVYKKQEKMYYPRFTKAIIHHFLIQEKFVSAKESTQIYGAILPECLTSPAMKESKAYKTYLGYATGVVPPKMAQKFKKASPSKIDSDLVLVDEEPVQKGKRVKRPSKKSTTKPAAGVVIREAPVETKSKSKEKEKVDVTRGKGIELLSEQEEEFEDDDQEDEEFVHTPSPTDDKDDDNLESKSDDVNKSNEESDDVNKRDEKSDDVIKGDKEIIQGEGADAEMIDDQQGNENLETTQEQVVEDSHVTISTVTKKTEVHITSSSCSSDLASKFLNFVDIPHTDAEIVSPLDVHLAAAMVEPMSFAAAAATVLRTKMLYEVSCIAVIFPLSEDHFNMSNSDELRHTDNTTLVPPRLPDTLPQVYHRRRPTLGLLILPSVSPFPPTIRRTARISIPPIEPNLAERARISAINLDDYQFDPLTPPPSPSSPFTMAAYQRMISETDPTQREEALTETGQNSVPVPETALTVCTTRLRGQLHTILEDMDRYPNAYLEELEAFMTLWDVKPRVEESSLETLSMDELITQLRQMCEDAEDRASNAQEEARQKRKEALEEVVQQIYRNHN
ncbi:hypothetical protein Tco_1410152 [Tanacetum coccineum]